MRSDASDRDYVQAQASQLRQVLRDPRLQDLVGRAAAQVPGPGAAPDKIAALLAGDPGSLASSGGQATGVPYLSRAPLVSMMQSQLEEQLDAVGVPDRGHPATWWSRLIRAAERLLHIAPGTFTPDDPDWYITIAQGVLERLAAGNAPFNPVPAEYDELADNARLVVVGDWGTGLPRAIDVADLMRQAIDEALGQGRQVHVLHLGDVYYSGFEGEDRRRFLDPWPVTAQQAAAGVTSWSLNGNHDMYSGGFGYFGTLLGDPRFRAQRSPDGKATSFFRLRSPSWDFVGGAAGPPRRLVLFSHHQLVSVYDKQDLGPTLGAKLAPVLQGDRVTAWWWGHEHRAITYDAAGGVRFPRCLGHGGVPIRPDPAPPSGSTPPITWHSTRTVREAGQKWNRFGFARLDLQPDRIDVAYIDDDGYTAHTETVT